MIDLNIIAISVAVGIIIINVYQYLRALTKRTLARKKVKELETKRLGMLKKIMELRRGK